MRERAGSALLTAILASVVALQCTSIFVVRAKRGAPDATIKTASNAM